MLIDTHAHVNFRSFKDDANQVLQRALDNGTWVINVGSQIDTSRQAVEIASQFKQGIFAAVGLHPEHTHSQFVDEEETHFLSREETFDYEKYKELALNPKVVGIGECGLDYYRLPEGIDPAEVKEKQKNAFLAQIKLAKELNKTLIVHLRSSKDSDDAVVDILEILKKEKGSFNSARDDKNQDLRLVLHSYTGSPEMIDSFIQLGAFVSFNGIITFDKTGNMAKVVKEVPLDRIVVETDCPYLTPAPNRGKRNEPLFVEFVAKKLAEIKGLGVQKISDLTTENARKLFQI